jgi:hypothetical protein
VTTFPLLVEEGCRRRRRGGSRNGADEGGEVVKPCRRRRQVNHDLSYKESGALPSSSSQAAAQTGQAMDFEVNSSTQSKRDRIMPRTTRATGEQLMTIEHPTFLVAGDGRLGARRG